MVLITRVFLVIMIFLALATGSCDANNTTSVKIGNGPGGTVLQNFPSSGNFYKLPTSFPPAKPGTIFRVQLVGKSNGYETLRVMYYTENPLGKESLATGLITYPLSKPPAEGWLIISWDHGTSGMAPVCAPSRYGLGGIAPNLGIKAIYTATDYYGLGPDNKILPYLNRKTEAESTVDIVRAAQLIPDAHASDTWLVVGDSEGGHASLSTGELAPSYAPNLDLIGDISIAPGALLSRTFNSDNPIVVDTIATMITYGYQSYDKNINPAEVITEAAKGVGTIVETQCASQIASYVLSKYLATKGQFFKVSPFKLPQAKTWFKVNDVPQIKTKVPQLLIAGAADQIVVPQRMRAVLAKMCSLGDRVEIIWLPTGNHSTELYLARNDIKSWIEARLQGKFTPTSCHN